MPRVLVLSATKEPLMPCEPARVRQLLKKGRAAVYRRYPFTIILKDRAEGDVQPLQFKVDPGSRQTGIALVADGERGKRVIGATELGHRGHLVHARLDARRAVRRARRNRKTRYRPARFDNRRRKAEWLPPSVQSRIGNIQTLLKRLSHLAPLNSLSMELVKFDTQALQNPEMSGGEYQQGELMGYEVREYLLEKWGRKCAYCGAENVRLEVEHITPRSRGGSNRVSNLCLACHACNQEKNNQTAEEFGHPAVQRKAKQPLNDATAVNVTRWALWRWFHGTGLSLETGTGGRTKWNRTHQGYPKAHWIDAACVGESGAAVFIAPDHAPLVITATGRGSRQMCRMDRFGFPCTSAKRGRRVHGFQTGDRVRAVVPTGTKAGRYVGRVAVRSSGRFNLLTEAGTIQGISYRYGCLLQRSDGYIYQKGEVSPSSPT